MPYKRLRYMRSSTRARVTGRSPGLALRKYGAKKARASTALAKRYVKASKSILGRKLKKKQVTIFGNGGQLSRFIHKKPITRFHQRLFKDIAPNFYVTNNSVRMIGPVGTQVASEFSYFSGGAYSGTSTLSDIAYLQFKINGSQAAGNPSRTGRMFLESCTGNYMLTNQDNGNCFVTIYDIVCRDDTSVGPVSSWSDGVYDESSTAANYTAVLNTPFSSQKFTTHYKVLQQTQFCLGTGQSHRHLVHYEPRMLFKGAKLSDSETYLRGLTLATLIVAVGAPYNDKVSQSNVTTGAVALDIVQSKQLRYSWLSDNDTNFTFVNNLPAITTEEVMNAATGAKADESSA